jgi:ABC-2 type transport system permease protein
MRHALAMEWQKLRPVHKTSRTIAVAVALTIAVSAIITAAMASSAAHMSLLDRQTFDPIGVSMEGANAAVIAFAAFGVLCVTREYATGMIAMTFLAQPGRLRVLVSKLVTHAGVAAVAGAFAVIAAFGVGQALLNTGGIGADWSAPGLAPALAGGMCYLVLVCIWGVAVGALVRSSAAGIIWMAFLLIVAPIVVQILPSNVVHVVGRWLPSIIGARAMSANADPYAFGHWTGLAVLSGYVLATLVAGGWRLVRVDP